MFQDKDLKDEVPVEILEKKDFQAKIPAGYIPIKMSTKGRLGVPPVIHVKNFTTEDLLDLSIGVDAVLPVKTIQALNRIIYEDVDVSEWPEPSVLELIIKVYSNFFTPFISQVPFPWTDEDIEYLKSKGLDQKILELKSGAWTPTVDINLATDVTITELDSNIKDTIKISKKDGSFKATFNAYPRIGDIIRIKDTLDQMFRKENTIWDTFKKRLEVRERMIEKGISENLPEINPEDIDKFYEFEAKKTMTLVKLTQALYLKSFMDEDLTNKSLSEKLKYLEDPRMDVTVSKKIEEQYNKIKFGLNDEVKVKNPITGQPCTRRFTFRTVDILQAIRSYQSSEYDIDYDD